jgi:hypothetical protein
VSFGSWRDSDPFALFLVSTGAECRDSLSRRRPTCHDKERKKHKPAASHFYRTTSKGYFILAAAKKQQNQPQRNVINYYFFCISKLPELIIWRVYTEPVGQRLFCRMKCDALKGYLSLNLLSLLTILFFLHNCVYMREKFLNNGVPYRRGKAEDKIYKR